MSFEGSEDSNKNKKTISYEDWMKGINQKRVSKQELNKLIMNFFLVEGYKDAAEKFKLESGTEISNSDLDFMSERIEIRILIHQGKIDQAIQKINNLNGEILENNQELLLNLKLQKLIEIIKQNQIDSGLEYAQNEILPLVDKNPNFMESVEKVMSLMAFEDISKSPVCFLSENSQKIKISSEVNYELLKTKSLEKESKLPTLMKMLLWSQERLKEKINFPVISNIATGEFKFDALKKPIIKETDLTEGNNSS